MQRMIDLRRLHYFVIVAEELHFTRAAERLHMAQPPLSYQIQQLERDLGVQLFERTRHSVQLTDAGQVLLEEARRLFGHAEQMVRIVQRVGHGEVGLLTIGFVPSASGSILPSLLRVFHQRFPDVRLLLKEMNPDQLVNGLHERRLDVGFLYLPLEDSELGSRPVLREALLAALPIMHPLAAQSHIPLLALANDAFILPPRYTTIPGLSSHIIEACRQAGFVPKVAQEAWLMQTIIGLVAANMGVALVPASVQNLHRAGVVYKPLQGVSAEVDMGIIWRCDELPPVLETFLRVVADVSDSNDDLNKSS